MKRALLVSISIALFLGLFVNANARQAKNLDSLVFLAAELAEQELFKAQFDNGLNYVDISYFEKLDDYAPRHEILLTITSIRVQSFKARLYQTPYSSIEKLEQLKRLLPKAEQLGSKWIQAKYFTILSGFYRSQNLDSCILYENKALELFEELGDNDALANLRATRISRMLDGYFSQDNREEAIKLIPTFEDEIEFSKQYSSYATAYNTRHLANIYRIYDIDLDKAMSLYKQSLALREEIGFLPFITASHYSIGEVYFQQKNYEMAEIVYRTSLDKAHEVHFVRYEIRPLIRLGDIALAQGDKMKARERYEEAGRAAAKNPNSESDMNRILEKLALIMY